MTDQHLLSEFARHRSEAAFAELVGRHAAWVRATAARTVGDGPAADDVVQAVLLALADKAPRLTGRADLTGWLFRATRYAVGRARRSDRRRQVHERAAARPEVVMPPAEPDWSDVAPVLDELVAGLGSRDRQAVLLRFHRQLPLADVGTIMGTSEQAARAQVRRAVDRLRVRLARRGVTGATVDGLTATLAARLVPRPVPADAAAAVARAAVRRRPPAFRAAVVAAATGGTVLAAAAVALVASGGGPPVPPPPAPRLPASRPASPGAAGSGLPGQTDVVRWDVLLTAAGGRAVADLGEPIDGDEQFYRGVTVDAAVLRRAVAGQADAGRVPGSDRTVFVGDGPNGRWGSPTPGWQLAQMFDYSKETVGLHGSLDRRNAQIGRAVDANHVRLTIDCQGGGPHHGSMYLLEPAGNGRDAAAVGMPPAALRYDADLAAGRSVAFLGRVRAQSGVEYDHLIVYEAFKVERVDQDVVALEQDSVGWCRLGPDTLRAWAAAARRPLPGAVRPRTAGPAFSRPLSDGTTVWLDGLARPRAGPAFAQWDPRGRWLVDPLYLPLPGDPPAGLWVSLGVSGSHDFDPPWPDGGLRSVPLSDDATRAAPIGDGDTAVDVGVLVGRWTEAGRFRPGQPLVVGPATYRVSLPNLRGDEAGPVRWDRSGPVSDDVADCVSAVVGPDALEQYEPDVELIRVRRPGAAMTSDRAHGTAFVIWDRQVKDVQFYRLWRRRRQWVRFDGFATEPADGPIGRGVPESVSPPLRGDSADSTVERATQNPRGAGG